jgi:hypothetical protein
LVGKLVYLHVDSFCMDLHMRSMLTQRPLARVIDTLKAKSMVEPLNVNTWKMNQLKVELWKVNPLQVELYTSYTDTFEHPSLIGGTLRNKNI